MKKWLPVVDPGACDGCGACVETCGPRCLEIRDGKAVLVAPGACGSEEHCLEPCPTRAIRMEWLACVGDRALGLWR